jgi:hypothetical protein
MTPWPIIRSHPSWSIGNTTNMPPPFTPFMAYQRVLIQHLVTPPAPPPCTNTTRSRWLQNVGSKLKWSSASSSDQCRSENERSSTSGKTMMEEVVEVAGFRSLPKYRIADGLLSVSFLHGPHSLATGARFLTTALWLVWVARRTPCPLKAIV